MPAVPRTARVTGAERGDRVSRDLKVLLVIVALIGVCAAVGMRKQAVQAKEARMQVGPSATKIFFVVGLWVPGEITCEIYPFGPEQVVIIGSVTGGTDRRLCDFKKTDWYSDLLRGLARVGLTPGHHDFALGGEHCTLCLTPDDPIREYPALEYPPATPAQQQGLRFLRERLINDCESSLSNGTVLSQRQCLTLLEHHYGPHPSDAIRAALPADAEYWTALTALFHQRYGP